VMPQKHPGDSPAGGRPHVDHPVHLPSHDGAGTT
jgi:hypothetical protein